MSPPLVGWKAIIEHSKKHGGPESERQLRRLAVDGTMPIYSGAKGGSVQADPDELDAWFKRRPRHLSARRLSDRVRTSPAKRKVNAKRRTK